MLVYLLCCPGCTFGDSTLFRGRIVYPMFQKIYTARRGIPHKIISDNAKTFKSAKSILSAMLNDPSVQHYFREVRLEWSFNLEKAPWWGGFFERLIKSTKRCLRRTIGQTKLTLDELSTAVIEVEMVLNSRPLTYMSTEDLEEPLTPSHLIIGRRILSLPTPLTDSSVLDDPDFELSTKDVSQRRKHLSAVIGHFWRRWNKEYLLELRENHRFVNRGHGASQEISEGDIVLIHDPDHPRTYWRMAKVEELIPSSDGMVRGAVVRVHSSTVGSSILRRPVQALYPLEINATQRNSDAPLPESVTVSSQGHCQCKNQIRTLLPHVLLAPLDHLLK